MMIKSSILLAAVITAGALAGVNQNDPEAMGRGNGPVVYVTSQALFYDSIVLTNLPNKGPFQLLVMGGPSGLMTEFGPGDKGYVGGRWWVDVNGDGARDDGDSFFLCPLLPPGRPEL
jgi:hypothetical protein